MPRFRHDSRGALIEDHAHGGLDYLGRTIRPHLDEWSQNPLVSVELEYEREPPKLWVHVTDDGMVLGSYRSLSDVMAAIHSSGGTYRPATWQDPIW